ncbi:hypothetical protein J437_LFUL015270 [Ladona fulva]|uniref:Uncharacterized protein n=1 Tax=Ladona fulva TaxID=123851 RepID=A0A8K0KP72_LADFU|nr:hypothetical protein J437_LFUL015270 [Ladona fulva]
MQFCLHIHCHHEILNIYLVNSDSMTDNCMFHVRPCCSLLSITAWLKIKIFTDYSDVKQDPKRLEHFESLQHILTEFFEVEDILPNPVEMMGIYGRLCVNGFNILDGEMSCIAAGIYLGPSIIDHSCRPNAVATFNGLTLQLRALEDMPKFDWTKVRISYVDLLSCRSDRREELKNAYYFWCDCVRCVIDKEMEAYFDEEAFSSSLACPHFGCGTAIILQRKNKTNIDPCKTCGYILSEDEMKNYRETEELTLEKMQSMGSTACIL